MSNFSALDVDDDNFDPTIIYTYAAVQFIVGIYHTIINNGDDIGVFRGVDLQQLLLNTTLQSILGNTSFFGGIPALNNLGRGDIFEGHKFKILNFNEDSYLSNSSSSLSTIGFWDNANGILLCSDTTVYNVSLCQGVEFRTYLNVIPSDSQPDLIVGMDASASRLLISLGVILLLMTITVFVFYYRYQKSKTIQNAQIKVISLMNTALFLGSIRVILSGKKYHIVNKFACIDGEMFM